MRSLLIAPDSALDPTMGGGQRTRLLFEALLQLGEVDLMVVGGEVQDVHRAMYPEARRLHSGRFQRPTVFGLLPVIRRVHPGIAYTIGRLIVPRSRHYAPDPVSRKELAATGFPGFDIVVGRYLEPVSKMAPYDGPPLLIDIDDRDDQKMLSAAQNPASGALKRWVAQRLHRSLQRIFAEKVEAAHHLWLASEEDAAAVAHPSRSVLPNIPFMEPPPGYRGDQGAQGRMLFVGYPGHGPNGSGLRQFMAEAWPKIRAARPDAHLRVVGKGWRQDMTGATAAEGVEAIGFVEDLAAEYEAAELVIAPVMEGGGTKIKVLEAMQFQKPVIAHRHSVSGFEAGAEAYLAADDMAGMADHCLAAMDDPALRQRLAAAGAAYVAAWHSREAFMAVVERDIRAAQAQKTGSGR